MCKTICILLLCAVLACEAVENSVESRGKKKKIALLVYFADIVLKKFFVLKLIYAFVFWVVLHKAGYFLSWFISYLKEQHDVPHHVPHHGSHHGYYESYGPYRRQGIGS